MLIKVFKIEPIRDLSDINQSESVKKTDLSEMFHNVIPRHKAFLKPFYILGYHFSAAHEIGEVLIYIKDFDWT